MDDECSALVDIQNSFCLSSFLWSCLIFTWQVWMSWLCSCLASTFLQCSDSSSVLQAAVLRCMVCTPRIDPVQAQPAISLCQQGLLFKCRVWIFTQQELSIPYSLYKICLFSLLYLRLELLPSAVICAGTIIMLTAACLLFLRLFLVPVKFQITVCSSGLVFVPVMAMQILSRNISFVSRIIIWNNKIQVDRLFLAEAMGNESGI